MKKNVITKVLLMLVILAMAVALVACGGSDSGSSTKKSSKTEVTELAAPVATISDAGLVSWKKISGAKGYIYDINGETTEITAKKDIQLAIGDTFKVKAIAGDIESDWSNTVKYEAEEGADAKLIKIVKSLSGLVNTIASVKTSDTVGANVGLNAYFTSEGETNDVDLSILGNIASDTADAKINFAINDEDYFTLGLLENVLYVRAGETALKFDLNALDESKKALAAFAIDKIVALRETGIDTVVDGLVETVEEALPGINGMFDINALIPIVVEEDGITLSITCSTLNTLLKVLPSLLEGVDIDEYGSYLDTAVEYAKEYAGIDIALKDGTPLSWSYIENQIGVKTNASNALLSLKVGIKSEDSVDTLTGLDVKFDLGALDQSNLNMQFGLKLGVVLDKKEVDISFGKEFKKQNPVINLGVALGKNEAQADLEVVLNIADGLAKKGNMVATAQLNVETKDHSATVKGYADDTGLVLDMSAIFAEYDVTGYTTQYKFNYLEDGGSVIEKLNDFITEAIDGGASNADIDVDAAKDEAADILAGFGIDLDKVIACFTDGDYSYLWEVGYNLVNDNTTLFSDKEITAEGEEAFVKLAFAYAGKYTTFEDKFADMKTVEEIIKEIVSIYEENGADLLDVALIADGDTRTAGAQIFLGGENNDLLDFVALFAKLPTVIDGEIDVDNPDYPNTASFLKGYTSLIPADVSDLIARVLGVSLDDVIDEGLYAEVVGNEIEEGVAKIGGKASLKGTANTVEGDEYVVINGAIGMTDASECVQFSKFSSEGYAEFDATIGDAAQALFEAAFPSEIE